MTEHTIGVMSINDKLVANKIETTRNTTDVSKNILHNNFSNLFINLFI